MKEDGELRLKGEREDGLRLLDYNKAVKNM
jgi:hypothetical protein